MQKVKIIVILSVFGLILFVTHQIDKNYFSILQDKFTSIYEDRLVVKNYLFIISRQLEQKKDYLISENPQKFANDHRAINDSIQVLLNKFANTRLTERESIQLNKLQENFDALLSKERHYLQEYSNLDHDHWHDLFNNRYEKIWHNMYILSEIQLTEGKRLISSSNRVFKSSDTLAYLEVGFLVLIGISFYLILIYKPSSEKKKKQEVD